MMRFNKISEYSGLNKDIWIIAITTFINKFGSMVIPFLTIYLRTGLKFTYFEIDMIMIFLGLGTIGGNLFSSKISDKIGFYKTMMLSLTCTGLLFLIFGQVTTFYGVCAMIFFITFSSDLFRPAMLTFIKINSNKENSAKALSLYRTADNLGFLFGPTLGSLVLLYDHNDLLFWCDGISCLLAVLFFVTTIKEKKVPYKLKKVRKDLNPISILSDRPYMLHLIITLITGILFFQIFVTIPIYDEEILKIPDYSNGFFISGYALIVVIFEFPIVSYVTKRNISSIKVIALGQIFMIIGFGCLLLNNTVGLILMLIFISFGVIFTYPFSVSFAMARSNKYMVAKYMAIISVSYSVARVLSSTIGTRNIANFGFNFNWICMIALGTIGFILSLWLQKIILKEEKDIENNIINSIFQTD
jgi:predicted MFS family arabinose efflux permease